MVSISFAKLNKMTAKRIIASSDMLALLLVFGNVDAQPYTFNSDNFLPPTIPQVTECNDDRCGGQIYLRMGEPVIADDRASVGIWLRVEPSADTVTPYLGNYLFHVAVGGEGITLDRTACTFEVASGVQPGYAYNPLGLTVGSTTPRSIRAAGLAPGFGTSAPSPNTHYTLNTDEFEQFGTFSCPVASSTGVNSYILVPANVFAFTIQAAAGDQRKLLLRADNSYRYYPL